MNCGPKAQGFVPGIRFLLPFSADKPRRNTRVLLWNGGLLHIHVMRKNCVGFLAFTLSVMTVSLFSPLPRRPVGAQHVWSESEDCLPFLQLAQDYISSCGKKTLQEVLEKVFKSFRPVGACLASRALFSSTPTRALNDRDWGESRQNLG